MPATLTYTDETIRRRIARANEYDNTAQQYESEAEVTTDDVRSAELLSIAAMYREWAADIHDDLDQAEALADAW